jgi:magnesium transporter
MIIMFPTLITSMFGMNLINGMENVSWGFPLAVIFCIICTVGSLLWFKRKDWL